MKKLITLSIAIAAYNEEQNIAKLLEALRKQVYSGFIVKEIVVVSDGSSDNTAQLVRRLKNPRIRLVAGKVRKGLAYRQNQIFNMTQSDYILLLDADILPQDTSFLQKLMKTTVKKKADLTGCKFVPLAPKNLLEKILSVSIDLKRSLFEAQNNGNNIYTCHGSVRVFSKRLYKKIHFTKGVGEDAFSYLYCIYHGYTYAYVNSTAFLYKLPSRWSDHEKQSIRNLQSIDLFKKDFGEKFVHDTYGGTAMTYGGDATRIARAFVYSLSKSPVYTSLYLFITVIMQMRAKIYKPFSDTWEQAVSSKFLEVSI